MVAHPPSAIEDNAVDEVEGEEVVVIEGDEVQIIEDLTPVQERSARLLHSDPLAVLRAVTDRDGAVAQTRMPTVDEMLRARFAPSENQQPTTPGDLSALIREGPKRRRLAL